MLKVTLKRSVIKSTKIQRDTVRGLGLRKLNSSRVLQDTPEIRGMVRKGQPPGGNGRGCRLNGPVSGDKNGSEKSTKTWSAGKSPDASDGVNPPVWARRAEKVTRVRRVDPAEKYPPALRAGRCPCSAACRRRDSRTRSGFVITWSTLKTWRAWAQKLKSPRTLLREKGLVKRRGPVKLLSGGDVSSVYTIKLDRVSVAAKAKIEAAGGSVVEQ